jgi:hypothetical protein
LSCSTPESELASESPEMELSSLAGVMVTDDNSVLPDTPRVGTGCGVAQLLGKGVGNPADLIIS